ncbi:uncharacterized protein LOC111716579 [Eurytemora carolleeae]|uniref:uncharacterized protein LOC111716579 n=1 Tax=Eurytemora carolleeae TaxID=1294199 RepID=UPI000C77BBD2|nr:uncharacterized protein LOC111716579 [Eurytemora carolleeae]|eukprot:XP_023347830.1 uncharacterized protein LOC111716579 [Eurytemora affinis]
MTVPRTVLVFAVFLAYAAGRLYTKTGKISKSTWESCIQKQIIETETIQCAVVCILMGNLCNSFHLDKENNICTAAHLDKLEYVLEEEEEVFAYVETEVLKGLMLIQALVKQQFDRKQEKK